MASIRKRTWMTGGEKKTAWVVDYFDQDGVRRLKTYPTKKLADAGRTEVASEIHRGVHTPDSTSITIAEAGEKWIEQAELDRLERSTVGQYRLHLDRHIKPLLGETKLSRLTAPMVRDFDVRLRKAKRSPAMVQKVLVSLGGIVAHAQAAGLVAQNVVRDARPRRARGQAKRHKGRAVIPTKAEIRALIEKAEGRWRPLVITMIFTGLRASEIRGLTWDDVDLDRKVITVSQRADAWNTIGSPKSEAARREIPLAPMVVNALKEWRLACPKGDLGLVFPNGVGRVENHGNIYARGLGELQIACDIAEPRTDEKGKPMMDEEGRAIERPRYGLHAFRHAAASLFIEQGFAPKRVQTIMGHASIQMTFDVYGHLFPSEADDQAAMEQMQLRLLGSA